MKSLRPFRFLFALSQRTALRFTTAGKGAIAFTLLAAVFGLDTQMNYAHGVFSLGTMLLLADFLASRRLNPNISVKRVLPDFLTAGQSGHYTLVVSNCGSVPLSGLILHERLRQPFPSAAAFSGRRDSVVARSNVFDRVVGYPDWLDWLRRLRCAEIDPQGVPLLPPGGTVEIDVPIRAVHRGLAVFERVLVARWAPLGLCQASVELDVSRVQPAAQTLPVLPARYAMRLPPAKSQRNLQPGGVSLAMRVGDSEEFRALRDYRPGDPLRAIHWRSWARTGCPVVREYQDEFFSRHALLVDTAAAGWFDPAFEAGISLAATFVLRPREADSLLDMLFVGDRVHRLTSGRGLGETASLLRVLATVTPSSADSFQPLANAVLQGAAQIGSLVCILLAWDEQRREFVRRVQALGVLPHVFVVTEAAQSARADTAPGVSLRWLSPGELAASGVAE